VGQDHDGGVVAPERLGQPDVLVQVALDPGDVLLGGRGVPAVGEPAADAAPHVAPVIVADVLAGVEPGLVAVVAGPPDGVGGVGVHGGGVTHRGPGALLAGVVVLQDAVALRAAGVLGGGLVAGRAGTGADAPVAERALPPPALHGRLGEHDILVDAPLAGGPAQDLLGGAGEVAID